MAKHKTPLLDQLESGPWPSFVSDLKQEAARRAKNRTMLNSRFPRTSSRTFWAYWSSPTNTAGPTGNTAASSAFSDTAAVLSVATATSRKFPGVAHFHTMRVNQPGGKFYTTEFLKNLCDLWEFRGSGITNMHGSTGDIIFLGTTTPSWKKFSMK
jgi:sulfite reductase alpha subunit